ncbi:hypothetical protein SVAN01_00073 [Stagonosporopsis vannaccii]|nr:hypothetical protein SVAN01_00073 [Stagonosporopsis vannaccii]
MDEHSIPPHSCNDAMLLNSSGATPLAGQVILCEPRFTPGSILVTCKTIEDRFVVTDILPAHFHGTRWSAQNLAFDKFRKRVEKKFGVKLHEHQIVTDIGSEFPYLVNSSAEWYTAMQLCHDAGLRQIKFHIQLKDVAWETLPEEGAMVQQALPSKWCGRMAVAGGLLAVAVGIAYVVDRMGQ